MFCMVSGTFSAVREDSCPTGNIQQNPATHFSSQRSNVIEAPAPPVGSCVLMGDGPVNSERWEATPVFWHVVALLLILLFALWLRPIPLQADPSLQDRK